MLKPTNSNRGGRGRRSWLAATTLCALVAASSVAIAGEGGTSHIMPGANATLLFPGAARNAKVLLEERVPVINFSLGKGDWLVREAPRFGHSVDLVDTSDLDAVRAAVSRDRPALVWVETPGNPLWTISDIGSRSPMA